MTNASKTVRMVVMVILSLAIMVQLLLLRLLKPMGTEEAKTGLALIPCDIPTKPVVLLSPDEVGDRSQTLVGGADIYRENFSAPPLQTAKKISPPPFLPWKLRVNPIEKHVNSIFNWKYVVIFFRAPLTRVKNFKGSLFLHQPPPPLQVFVNSP